jgi:hypothetical protein
MNAPHTRQTAVKRHLWSHDDYFRFTRFGLAHLAQSHGLAVVRVQK